VSKVVKALGAAFAAVLILALVGAAALLWRFDPNDYKSYVEEWAQASTGRELTIAEDLELGFLPSIAIETGGVTIGNAAGFEGTPFATVAHAAVRIKLLPLLRREIEIGRIVLDGLELNFARDAQGRGNWEDLLAREPVPTDAAPVESAEPWIERLDVEGVSVRGGRIAWRRNVDELRYAVNELSVTTGHIAAGARVDIELAGELLDVASALALRVNGSGGLALDSGGGVTAEDLDLEFVVSEDATREHARGRLQVARLDAAPGGVIDIGETALAATLRGLQGRPGDVDAQARFTRARFDSEASAASVEGLVTTTGAVEIAWQQLEGQTLVADPTLSGAIAVREAPAAELIELLAVELPAGIEPAGLGALDATAAFRVRVDPFEVALSDLEVRALDMQGRGRIELAGERLTAQVDVPAFRPSAAFWTLLRPHLPDSIDTAAIDRVSLRGRLASDLAAGSAEVRDLEVSLLGATLTGELDVVPRAGGDTLYRGTLETSRFAAEPLANALGTLLSDKLDARELGTLALDARFVYERDADRLRLAPFAAEVFGLTGRGELEVRSLAAAPVWSGRLEVASFTPRDLFRRFGQPVPETADPAALTRAAIDTRFTVDEDRGRFENIVLALDDSRISGDFTVDGFQLPGYSFTLAIDRVNVDRYLPPKAADAQAGETTAGDVELPTETLANMKLNGQVEVGELELAGLKFAQVGTEIVIGDRSAALNGAKADLYGGRFEGSLTVDGRAETPGLALNGRATGLALEPLIQALTAEEANFSGTGNFDLALTGRGAKVIDNVRSAAGTMSFTLSEGAIKGFNLGRSLCAVYNAAQKLPKPADAPLVTAYQTIRGTARVDAGVAQSSDLLARTVFMDVAGGGNLGLAEQRLDYDLQAELTGPIAIQGCESMRELVGQSLPLRIRGTVTEPEIMPDFRKIIEDRLKRQLERNVTDRLQERLQDLIGPR
jgi:AsmA protein